MHYLSEQLRGVIALDHEREAFVSRSGSRTWGEVRGISEALDRRHGDAGLGPGTPVGVLLRTRADHAAALIGVFAGARCAVTLNPIIPDAKLAADILQLRPPAIAAGAEDWNRSAFRGAAKAVGAIGLVLTGDPAAPVALIEGLEKLGQGSFAGPAQDVAVLMLTSGTTGEPKRAPLGYSQLETQLKRAARADDTRSDDEQPRLRDGVSIHHAPLVHISGVWGLLATVLAGRMSYLIEKFNVQEWRDAVVRYRPTTAGGPPAMLRMIFDANLSKEEMSSINVLGTGTAAVEPDLVDAFLERYGIPVLATYGATEFAGGVAGWSLRTFQKYWRTKRGAAGRMNPGCEARIVDSETGDVLPLGAEGLLELRARVVGDGQSWVRTSDYARLDEDHFIWILGRADNAIVRGGFKIMPDEVVRALEAHPNVKEASVVGLPDLRLGHVPVAAIVLREGRAVPSEGDLTAQVRADMAAYCVPVKFKFVEELPRTPSMKVSMPAVQALFSGVERTDDASFASILGATLKS
ncbi:MAG: class I adenylate-forming enzyme family protein [Caulobacteraceae bacterium]